MIKIDGLSEDQIIKIINKVANNHRMKCFSFYTQEDIFQEVWIIVLDRIKEFDITKCKQENLEKSLEHFLNNVVSRRLSNFYRDNYVVPQKQLKSDQSDHHRVMRVNLMHPLNISNITENLLGSMCDILIDKECFNYIVSSMSDEYIDILDTILSTESISSYYKNRLYSYIYDLIEKHNNGT